MSGIATERARPSLGILDDAQYLKRDVARFISIDAAGLLQSVHQTAGVITQAWMAIAAGSLMRCLGRVLALAALFPGTPLWIGYGRAGTHFLLAGARLQFVARTSAELLNDKPGILATLTEYPALQATLARDVGIGTLIRLVRGLARDAVALPLEQPADAFLNETAKRFGGSPLARGDFDPPPPAESARPVA